MGSVKIVSASAGSGKTYSLAYEYVRNVIHDPEQYKAILAVTFTNKATEEMKQRILTRIDGLARDSGDPFLPALKKELSLTEEEIQRRAKIVRSKILHDYTRFSILTIDKFFQRIIRSFIIELGIEFNFTLELPTDSLLSKATDRLIDNISVDRNLREWIMEFVNERIDENKKWDIRDEVMSLGREIFNEDFKTGLASARSREELEKIISHADAEARKAEKELVAAANAILNILIDNSLSIADISGGSRGVMSYVTKIAGGEILPATESKSMKNTLESGKWYPASSKKKDVIDPVIPRLDELLSAMFAADKVINSAALLKENYRNFALLSDLEERIADVAREEEILHISEINPLLFKLISNNDTPFVFEKSGNYYSRFMIDEFQDTSGMQWENFLPLLRNSVAQSAGSPVMLVGDVKQSIYRWRGGDWTILGGKAEARFDETTTSMLSDNYRSRRKIVEFNNAMIGSCAAAADASVNTALSGALARNEITRAFHDNYSGMIGAAYADYAQTPADESDGGYVTVTFYDRDGENKFTPPVIAIVEEAQSRGYAPGEIAILVREKRQGREIANMLLGHKGSHPESPYSYDVITQEALAIGNSPVCNFITACFRLSANINDDISRAVYNRFTGRAFNEPSNAESAAFLSGLRLLPPEEAFEAVVMRYELGKKESDISYLQAIHQQIISFSASKIADIPLFLEWWYENGHTESISMPSGVDAINIDTIHRSKGLGYKVVIIPFADWGMTTRGNSTIWASNEVSGSYPVGYKKEMSNSMFAEEYYREYIMSHIDNLNLLYVALTRAAEELHVMLPRTKTASAEKISFHISEAIRTEGADASVGILSGRVSENEGISVAKFGMPAVWHRGGEKKQKNTVRFESYGIRDRLSIKLGSQRYFDDGVDSGKLSPRDYGILMHKVLEQAVNREDFEKTIASMLFNGAISAEEAGQLKDTLTEAFTDPAVKEWFDGSWEDVRNENDIIVPGNEVYRPDRVMIKEGCAVVIDYKFTAEERAEHKTQLKRYMKLLADMGYQDIKGYLWYMGFNKITEVR